MIRSELKNLAGKTVRFTATLDRAGTKPGNEHNYYAPIATRLLVDIRDSEGNIVADHLWIDRQKKLKKLKTGTLVHFSAYVKRYEKAAYKEIEGIDLQVSDGFDYGLVNIQIL